jgi:hypothetical protein
MLGRSPTISTSKDSIASPWKTVLPDPFIPECSAENGSVAGAATAGGATATTIASKAKRTI